jgi:hypothetical protein
MVSLVDRVTFTRLPEVLLGLFLGLLLPMFLALLEVLLLGIDWVRSEIIKGRVCMKRSRSWIRMREDRFWRSWRRVYLHKRWGYNGMEGTSNEHECSIDRLEQELDTEGYKYTALSLY